MIKDILYMSWRLLGQEEYLSNKKFIKVNILEYKNKFKKKGRFHEHCEFCFEKIENIDLAFCTKDFYYWICPECFNDFKLKFNFEDFKYKYFILNHEREGSFYHEFVFGKPKMEYWNELSLYIEDSIMDEIELWKIFEDNIPNYDYYGSTIIDEKGWTRIKENLSNYSECIQIAILEINEWVEYAIKKYKCFSILGI
jgi:hypothetical protein